jgi:hypothetical protein
MTTTTPGTSRTARLLALMTKGDNAFNARDFAAVGRSRPSRHGRLHHRAGRAGLRTQSARRGNAADPPGVPDMHVNTPYPTPFGGGDWITVITTVTGTFTGQMTLPDGTVTPRQARRSIASSTRGFAMRQGDTPYLISPDVRLPTDQDENAQW